MGGVDSKTLFKGAIQDLGNNEQVGGYFSLDILYCTNLVNKHTIKNYFQLVAGQNEAYWDRFWSAGGLTAIDFFVLVTPDEMRNLRDNASGNLTTFCFKVRGRQQDFHSHKLLVMDMH